MALDGLRVIRMLITTVTICVEVQPKILDFVYFVFRVIASKNLVQAKI